VLLLAFRDGRNLGTRAFFPKTNGSDNPQEVLAAFVSQYYVEQPPPGEIVIDRDIPDRELIEHALSSSGERKVQLRFNVRAERAGYLDMARRNAELSLASERTSHAAQHARAEALREMMGMSALPSRMECFDISHTMGEATWPRAWCSMRRDRYAVSTGATTSQASSRATTTPPCTRPSSAGSAARSKRAG
jgi:excinuclease ABC subunit C